MAFRWLFFGMSILCIFGALSPVAAATLQPQPREPLDLFWYRPQMPTIYAGENIGGLAHDPTTPGLVIASERAGGALMRSRDGGVSWAKLDSWAPTDQRFNFYVSYGAQPRTFYVWSASQIYRTTDAGDSWTLLAHPGANCGMVGWLAVHPAIPTLLYLGAQYGFDRSADGGQSWKSMLSPDQFCDRTATPFKIAAGVDRPNVVYAGRSDSNGGGVLRSDDRGDTWQSVSTGFPDAAYNRPAPPWASIQQLHVDPRDASVAYALTELGELYRTTTSGAFWQRFQEGIADARLSTFVLDTAHGYTRYTLTNGRIYALPDGATVWQLVNTPPLPRQGEFYNRYPLWVDPHDAQRFLISPAGVEFLVSLPVPEITSLGPNARFTQSGAFTLTVNGRGFTPKATIRWQGRDLPTTFISEGQLAAAISATATLTPGIIAVTVGYADHPDGTSNAASLPIVPRCTATVGSQTQLPKEPCTLTLPSELAGTLAYSHTFESSVVVTAPIGTSANTLTLRYTPVPTVTTPSGRGLAGLAFELDVVGAAANANPFAQPLNLVLTYADAEVAGLEEQQLALVYWEAGSWRDAAATCPTASTVQQDLVANKLTTAICRPGRYALLAPVVAEPAPQIHALDPDVVLAGSGPLTLTISGDNFSPATTAYFNGSEQPTTVLSRTQLYVAVSASAITAPGVLSITLHTVSSAPSNVAVLTVQPRCQTVVQGSSTSPADACAVALERDGGSLIYRTTAQLTTTITVPPGSVSESLTLRYTPLLTVALPSDLAFGGIAFELESAPAVLAEASFSFVRPITITLDYAGSASRPRDDGQLILGYWDGQSWIDATTTCTPAATYQRRPEVNRLVAEVCATSRFALLWRDEQAVTRHLALPLVVASGSR
jgi:photosystem II stability/assembly factor-like uncharacterized protein